jgi:hypothetical protein
MKSHVQRDMPTIALAFLRRYECCLQRLSRSRQVSKPNRREHRERAQGSRSDWLYPSTKVFTQASKSSVLEASLGAMSSASWVAVTACGRRKVQLVEMCTSYCQ